MQVQEQEQNQWFDEERLAPSSSISPITLPLSPQIFPPQSLGYIQEGKATPISLANRSVFSSPIEKFENKFPTAFLIMIQTPRTTRSHRSKIVFTFFTFQSCGNSSSSGAGIFYLFDVLTSLPNKSAWVAFPAQLFELVGYHCESFLFGAELRLGPFAWTRQAPIYIYLFNQPLLSSPHGVSDSTCGRKKEWDFWRN